MNLRQRIEGALLRNAAKQAQPIRRALNKSIDVDAVIRAWNETHPAGGETTPLQARQWAQVHVVPKNHDAVVAAIRNMLTAGYRIGERAATAHYAKRVLRKAPSKKDPLIEALNTDWSTWSPGYEQAAELVRPSGALSSMLAEAGVTASLLNKTTLNRIGTRLADALNNGWADTKLAAAMTDIIDDPVRALMIANTEMARAMSTASVETYQGFGVEMVEWMHSDYCQCEDCTANEDAGPIPLGTEFPSGDTEPPAHPNCICSIAPVIDMGDGTDYSNEMDMIEMSVKTGIPGPAEVLRAQSRLAILPNPADPTLDDETLAKYVESPWATVSLPTIDPNLWDDAKVEVVRLEDLLGTDAFLSRKKVAKHIDSIGQALTEFRSYALVIEDAGRKIIVDGHHRLMASWLLGMEEAPVWQVTLSTSNVV